PKANARREGGRLARKTTFLQPPHRSRVLGMSRCLSFVRTISRPRTAANAAKRKITPLSGAKPRKSAAPAACVCPHSSAFRVNLAEQSPRLVAVLGHLRLQRRQRIEGHLGPQEMVQR